jgi:hypothetical protein
MVKDGRTQQHKQGCVTLLDPKNTGDNHAKKALL